MKKLVLVLFSSLLLTGCFGGDEEVTTEEPLAMEKEAVVEEVMEEKEGVAMMEKKDDGCTDIEGAPFASENDFLQSASALELIGEAYKEPVVQLGVLSALGKKVTAGESPIAVCFGDEISIKTSEGSLVWDNGNFK